MNSNRKYEPCLCRNPVPCQKHKTEAVQRLWRFLISKKKKKLLVQMTPVSICPSNWEWFVSINCNYCTNKSQEHDYIVAHSEFGEVSWHFINNRKRGRQALWPFGGEGRTLVSDHWAEVEVKCLMVILCLMDNYSLCCLLIGWSCLKMCSKTFSLLGISFSCIWDGY